ncbi:retrovirus-related pol polyprotein from transposon TNT 1-94 [Tanacetum coccineum]
MFTLFALSPSMWQLFTSGATINTHHPSPHPTWALATILAIPIDVQWARKIKGHCDFGLGTPQELKSQDDLGCVPLCPILHCLLILLQLVEIILFIVESGCSKHMTGNLKLQTNFVEKFLGTVKFGNDQIAPILGYGDLVQGTIPIKQVYYVEGLNHNLFSVGQFCYADLEVAFRKSTCYIRDLKGNNLLTGSRGTYLYSITLQDTSTPNPICLMAKATSSQAWLWHRHLSHLNFDTINLLSNNNIVTGLLKLKFVKDHLCSSCELGKAKRKSFHTKTTPSSKRRSKDKTPAVLIDFLTLVQRGLHAQVRTVRTDKGTEFLNKNLHEYFAKEGIRHEASTARTPEQNGVVKI